MHGFYLTSISGRVYGGLRLRKVFSLFRRSLKPHNPDFAVGGPPLEGAGGGNPCFKTAVNAELRTIVPIILFCRQVSKFLTGKACIVSSLSIAKYGDNTFIPTVLGNQGTHLPDELLFSNPSMILDLTKDPTVGYILD